MPDPFFGHEVAGIMQCSVYIDANRDLGDIAHLSQIGFRRGVEPASRQYFLHSSPRAITLLRLDG